MGGRPLSGVRAAGGWGGDGRAGGVGGARKQHTRANQELWQPAQLQFLLGSSPSPNADIDREISELQREEKKLILEIKAAGKAGNEASMKILAKSLIRLRGQVRVPWWLVRRWLPHAGPSARPASTHRPPSPQCPRACAAAADGQDARQQGAATGSRHANHGAPRGPPLSAQAPWQRRGRSRWRRSSSGASPPRAPQLLCSLGVNGCIVGARLLEVGPVLFVGATECLVRARVRACADRRRRRARRPWPRPWGLPTRPWPA